MLLSFKTKINDNKTHFPEKILVSIEQNKLSNETLNFGIASKNHKPKHHTIRKDEKNRWKPGMMIDFFINARQKNMFRFAPRIPVISKQRIFMTFLPQCGLGFRVSINGRELDESEVEKLAINDGFEAIEDFEDYFIKQMKNDEFSGKIIHWTDLKY